MEDALRRATASRLGKRPPRRGSSEGPSPAGRVRRPRAAGRPAPWTGRGAHPRGAGRWPAPRPAVSPTQPPENPPPSPPTSFPSFLHFRMSGTIRLERPARPAESEAGRARSGPTGFARAEPRLWRRRGTSGGSAAPLLVRRESQLKERERERERREREKDRKKRERERDGRLRERKGWPKTGVLRERDGVREREREGEKKKRERDRGRWRESERGSDRQKEKERKRKREGESSGVRAPLYTHAGHAFLFTGPARRAGRRWASWHPSFRRRACIRAQRLGATQSEH